MYKTKAELVAENRVLKAGMSKTKEKLIEQNDILETRLFHHAEFINGLEDELKRNQGWVEEAKKRESKQQHAKEVMHQRHLALVEKHLALVEKHLALVEKHLALVEKYGNLSNENVRLTDLEDRYARTIDLFNRLICDDDR